MLSKIPTSTPDIASRVIRKFGDKAKMAALTGLPFGTIDYWEKTGNIPEKYRPGLLLLAQELGIDHTPYDYIAYMLDIRIAA
jgi:hypothetical protein